MIVEKLSQEKIDLEIIKPLLNDYRFKPYSEYRDIPNDKLTKNFLTEIQGKNVFLAKTGDKVIGLATLERLEWDTKHFGVEMNRIRHLIGNVPVRNRLMKFFHKECTKYKIAFLSYRTHTSDVDGILAAELNGFNLFDVTVKYAFDFRKQDFTKVRFAPTCKVRMSRESDLEMLVEIAKTYKDNRFHRDRNLLPQADELYAEWIRNSCQGMADVVLVATVNEEPVGFTTLKYYRELSKTLGVKINSLVFSGVSPRARGKYVYTSMIYLALKNLHEEVETDIAELGTLIDNYAVQKAWSKLGFKIVSSACMFHKWIKPKMFNKGNEEKTGNKADDISSNM